jgi:hypothetical protein
MLQKSIYDGECPPHKNISEKRRYNDGQRNVLNFVDGFSISKLYPQQNV